MSHFNVEEMVVDLFIGLTKVQSGKLALIVTAVSVTPAIGRLSNMSVLGGSVWVGLLIVHYSSMRH